MKYTWMLTPVYKLSYLLKEARLQKGMESSCCMLNLDDKAHAFPQ